MKAHRYALVVLWLLLGAGCTQELSSEERVATTVAEQKAVAATLTVDAQNVAATQTAEIGVVAVAETSTGTPTEMPEATTATLVPDPPTPTPTATLVPDPPTPTPTATLVPDPPTPTPTATLVLIFDVPTGGGDDTVRSVRDTNDGKNVLLPGFSAQEAADAPLTFRGRIGMALEVYLRSLEGGRSGDGIDLVTFRIDDETSGADVDNPVFVREEMTAPYCLFGGNTYTECLPRTFEQLGYRWPGNGPIYNGDYRITMEFETDDGFGSWNLPFRIEGALPRPDQDAANFGGTWYTNVGIVELTQNGNQVSGTYQSYGDPQAKPMDGTVADGVLTGNYYGDEGGSFRFELSIDGQRFDGTWRGQYDWCGVRSGALPPGCGYSGSWESIGDYTPNYQPTISLTQIGDRVTGTFLNGVNPNSGTIEGRVGTEGVGSQLTATGTWSVGGNSGPFRWRLVNLGSDQFRGRSVTADGQAHQWCGWRPGLSRPEPCFE